MVGGNPGRHVYGPEEVFHRNLPARFSESPIPRAGAALSIENRRRALAESHFELGEKEKADGLYRRWLEADPRWGWGWIGWSDCYRFERAGPPDIGRAEHLLREALGVPDVRDRREILGRLKDLYEEQGRREEAGELRRQLTRGAPKAVVRQTKTVTFAGEGLPLSELPTVLDSLRAADGELAAAGRKVGRNEPCPCGSGKKFKRCCGRA
jgi:tetratricopeptide (TPR) repeat protein